MKVKIWGTRGSIPAPLKPEEVKQKIRRAILGLPDIDTKDPIAVDSYLNQLSPLVSGTAGGNTTCVEIQAGQETFIIDAGSGLRELGLELIKGACGRGQGTLHFLFTHPHWDHLQGFPFFVPAFIPGNRIFIHSIHDIKLALETQQSSLTFPVPLSATRANIEFISHQVGEPFSIGGISLNTIKNAHPGDAYSYRFEDGRNIFVFASDAEYKQLEDKASLHPHIEFFKDADALIFDAQYTLKEGFQKEDWGHSSAMIGVDIARMAGVKQLVLFHHDPTYSDEQLLDIQQRAIEYQAQTTSGSSCEIIVAYEGLILDLTPLADVSLHPLSDDDEAVLTPVGSLDEQGLATLRRQLSHWEEVGWPSRLVIDLSEAQSLTIAGLKSLISLRKERVDTVIALAGLSESSQQVIDLAGFSDYFAIYPTVEIALSALQAAETLNLPGQLIKDRYRIESRLGDSWQGAVFKATDIHTNRMVALTILSASFGEKAINEIIRQTQQVIGLKHPNITNILECGIDQDFSYIVEEFIEGQSLLEVLKYYSGEPLPTGRARDISLGILSALEYAHSRGMIHYNLTPRNIFLADELKLANFGLGDLEKGRQLLERPLVLLEAPYLAPEQILGQSPDARTDLYALGTIMYELFTGRPLFSGTDLEVMQAHLNQPPDPPSIVNPQLSGSLEFLILKLLAKDPDERYATVHQTRQILSSLVVGDEGETGLSALFYGEQTPLVGRASELEQMEAVRAAVQQTGTPHLLVVQGEMGVGKTRLVAEFLLRSIEDQDFTVLIGSCDEFGAPYAPYAEILTTIFNKGFVNPQTIIDQAKHLRLQIPSLASVLSPYEQDGGTSVLTDAKGAQWHFFEAILLILSKLGPTVLVLEDAAFLDEASIALTRFLIRRAQLPLLIIVAGRDDEEANLWLNALKSGKKEIVSLAPLPVPEVEEYLTSLMGGTISEAVTTVVQKRTHGNPYYIEEITNYLIDQGTFYQTETGEWEFNPENGAANLPPALMKLFAQRVEKLAESRRIEDLTESSREALAVAAVIGSEFDFRLWVDVLEVEMGGESQEALALDTLDEALALRILHQSEEDEHYIFDSVDIADILVSSLLQARQRNLHQQIAEILSRRDGDPLIISQHYQEAELTAQAAHYLEVAGAKAVVGHDINEAITYYDRAMVLEESQAGYETLGNLYFQKGASTEAIWAYQRALNLAEKAKDSLGQARILNGLSFVYWWMLDRYEEAHQAAIKVLNLSDVPEIERATAQSHLGMISWMVGRLDEAEDWCRKSLETFMGSEDEDRLAAVYSRLGLVYFSQGKFAEATEAAEQSLEIRRTLDDRWGQAMCLNNLARIAADQGDFEQAQAYFDSARHLLEDMDSPGGLLLIYTHQSYTLLLQKQADEAVSSLLKALDQTEELRQTSAHALGEIYLLLAQAHLQRDDLGEARAAIDEALKLVEPVQSQEQIATTRATLAQIHAAEGDYTTADVLFQKSLEMFEEVGTPAGLLRTRISYARFLAGQNRTGEANALEQSAQDEASRLGLYL